MKRRAGWQVLGTLILIGLLLQACGGAAVVETPEGQAEEPVATETTEVAEETVEADTLNCAPIEDSTAPEGYTDGYGENDVVPAYVDGVVLVSGNLENIDAVIERLNLAGLGLSEIESMGAFGLDGFGFGLYDYDDHNGTLSIWDIILLILAEAEADELVHVDPDYIIGLPYHIGGSPYHIGGSGGSPQPGATEGEFWGQWALTRVGVGALRLGEDTSIAVFDTSPYASQGPKTFGFSGPGHDAFRFCAQHWEVLPTRGAQVDGNDVDLSDHGLSVAGLAHAVAPAAKVTLIRILNQEADGDLFTLVKAMTTYLAAAADANNGEIGPQILNLSLGFRPAEADPPPYLRVLYDRTGDLISVADEYSNTLERLGEFVGDTDGRPVVEYLFDINGDGQLNEDDQTTLWDRSESITPHLDPDPSEEPFPVLALRLVTGLATDQGAVVVAAAGNGSRPGSTRLTSDAPAQWNHIVGVAGITQSKTIACYSNSADSFAPAADGFDPAAPPDDECKPMPEICLNLADSASRMMCEYGVIGPITDTQGEDGEFAFWVGTSFAAPLVTGWASTRVQGGATASHILQLAPATFPMP